MRRNSVLLSSVALLAAALGAAACTPMDRPSTGSPATGASTGATGTAAAADPGDCTKDKLTTLSPGKLTFGTDQPAYQPWYVDDDPMNGKGFESAVAYAVAEKLGYAKADVAWTRVPFTAAIQPGAKTYDADLNQFSITDERKQAVDFSSPYYEVAQAVIAPKNSPAAQAKSLAELKSVKLGAQVGTTSYTAATQLAPTQEVAVYNTNDDAKAALANGQIQALVVDLPTAFYMTSAELPDAAIVGQIPATAGAPTEQFGIVLDKGSPLTRCVSAAVDALRADGTLDQLQQQWLTQAGNVPELK